MKNTLFTFLAGIPTTNRSINWSLFKDPKLQRWYTTTSNIDSKDYVSRAVRDTKVYIVDVFNYEFPTSSPPWSNSRWMTSFIGRVIWRPSLVHSTTVLIWPSRPLRNSSMRARPHKCLGRTPSCVRKTSPRRSWAVFPTWRWTLWKLLSSIRYSFVQRFQKSSVFVSVEVPSPGSASLWALVLWVLCWVLQSRSVLKSVLRNPHLAW